MQATVSHAAPCASNLDPSNAETTCPSSNGKSNIPQVLLTNVRCLETLDVDEEKTNPCSGQGKCQGGEMEVETCPLKTKGTRFKPFHKTGSPSRRGKKACEDAFLVVAAIMTFLLTCIPSAIYFALEVSLCMRRHMHKYTLSTQIYV